MSQTKRKTKRRQMKNDLLSIHFSASNTVRGRKPYTIYEIEARSSATMSWLLYKRYRDFDMLHQNLTKLIQTHKEYEKIKLRDLPPKRLVRSLAPEVVSKRQRELEVWLKHIIKNPILIRIQLILDFLIVPESLRSLLIKRANQINKTMSYDSRSSDSHNANQYNKSLEQRHVNALLKELSLQKNRVKALSKFEQWYFDVLPNLRPELIKILMVGDETHQGLVHSCRLLHSKVAWRGSISLLVRLLDIERNKYARTFQEVFLTLDTGILKEMDLHRHIKDATQEDGFRIVQLIRNNLPQLDPKFYVPDNDAWKQYQKWNKIQNETIAVDNDNNDINSDNDDVNNIKIFDYKEMRYKKISEIIFNKFKILSNETDDEYKFIPKLNEKYGHQLKVRYKKDNKTNTWKLKITYSVNNKPSDVYQFLKNSFIQNYKKMYNNNNNSNKYHWNTKIVEQNKIKELDKKHYIIHTVYETFNTPYTFRDFVKLICLKEDKNNKYIITFASINNYDSIPDNKYQRTIILPSGFEIKATRDNPNKTHVSYRAHLTNESLLIVSADLLGETDQLYQSMIKIEKMISNTKQSSFNKFKKK